MVLRYVLFQSIMITLPAIRTGELWELSRVSLCHHGSILFTEDVDTKSYFPTFILFYCRIFLKYPALLRLADEEQNNLILFSLPLRVSSRVNKQRTYSFYHCGEIRNTQMVLTWVHFVFDLQLQINNKMWRGLEISEEFSISLNWTVTRRPGIC